MAIVLSTDKGMLVHQSSLLKAVRTVYNVFLLSNDAPNQIVAQGGLTQMVHHVFGRVVRPNPNAAPRRGTVGENEARRLEREAEDEAARLAVEGNGAEGGGASSQNATGANGAPKLTL
jgi:brefeldin A-inhibited guanine nucleotide-exchange protein